MPRLRAPWHVAGITLILLYFLYSLSKVFSTLLNDASPYTLIERELSAGQDSNIQIVPKIIHQVYLGWGGLPMPDEWLEPQQTCRDFNPDFEHIFWNNETARALLEKDFPWFLHTWDNYKYPIQRADSIRYFILARHGGLYVDLDNGCRRNLTPLLAFPAWMPGTVNQLGLTNHVMGATPSHPYFDMLIHSLDSYNRDWALPYLTIMNSAGPHFVSMVWDRYLKGGGTDVRVLSVEGYEGAPWSFFTKEMGGTWHHWDTALFAWAGKHVPIVVAAAFAALFAVAGLTWWVGWRLLVLVVEEVFRARGGGAGAGALEGLPWRKAD